MILVEEPVVDAPLSECDHLLPVGICVRALRIPDLAEARRMARACSVSSLRDRFFGHVEQPERALVEQLEEAVWEGAAAGAFVRRVLVGFAVGQPQDGPTEWELAVLVQDEFQGLGLGELVARHVLAEGRGAGAHVHAMVEAGNARAVRLARRLQRTDSDGVLRTEVC